MKNEVSVSLIIYGYDDLDQLTKRLGLTPTKAVMKGQPLFEGAGPIPRSMWELQGNDSAETPLEEQLKSSIAMLGDSKLAIANVASEYKVVIAVGARYVDPNPEIEFEPLLLKDISDLGARLWLDMYVANEDEG